MKELLEQLLLEAHGKNVQLPQVVKDKMIQDLAIQLEQRLFAAAANYLTAPQLLQLRSATVEPVEFAKAEAILQTHIPNYQAFLTGVYEQFRQDYLQVSQ